MSEYTVLYKNFNIPLPSSYTEGDHRIFVTATSQYYLVTVHYNLDSENAIYQKKDVHRLNLVELENNNIVWDSATELEVSESFVQTPPDFRQEATIDPNQTIGGLMANNCFQEKVNESVLSNFTNVVTREVDVEAKIYIFKPDSTAKSTEDKITDLLLTAPKNIIQSIEFEVDETTLTFKEETCETVDEKITLFELPGGMELTEEELPAYSVVSGLIFLK